jgi:hypothetical protein
MVPDAELTVRISRHQASSVGIPSLLARMDPSVFNRR